MEHPWNTPGRPRYGKPGARLAILRLVTSSNPDRTWFCIFPSRSQVRVRLVQKNFQVVMGSNPGLGTLLSTFAVVTGSSPGRAKRWSFYRMFHECSTSVPRVFHECWLYTRGTSWRVLESWNTRGTPVEHRGPGPPRPLAKRRRRRGPPRAYSPSCAACVGEPGVRLCEGGL